MIYSARASLQRATDPVASGRHNGRLSLSWRSVANRVVYIASGGYYTTELTGGSLLELDGSHKSKLLCVKGR